MYVHTYRLNKWRMSPYCDQSRTREKKINNGFTNLINMCSYLHAEYTGYSDTV